jgi:hypothetical protein
VLGIYEEGKEMYNVYIQIHHIAIYNTLTHSLSTYLHEMYGRRKKKKKKKKLFIKNQQQHQCTNGNRSQTVAAAAVAAIVVAVPTKKSIKKTSSLHDRTHQS